MGSRVPLAWSILADDRRRFAWSLLGVAFAVLLMFVEMGFLNGSYDSTTLPVERMNADLVMINRLKENMFPPKPFPRSRLMQARGFEGVAAVHPLYVEVDARWRNPEDGRVHPVRVFAFDPADPVWLLPGLGDAARRLERPETCLFDSASRDYYGEIREGMATEMEGRRVVVGGTFTLGPDLGFDGNLFLSDSNLARYFPDPPGGPGRLERVEFGLIRVADGADVGAVAATLADGLIDDVVVLTPEQLVRRIHAFWRRYQPVGAVFALGMVVGFVIGVTVCYQILFTEVADHLAQYGTLKAIGYRDRYLVGVVLRQGLYLSLAGFVPGLALSWIAYRVIAGIAGLQMTLTPLRVLFVLALTVAMCVLSAALAIRKVLRSDPAEVF